MNRADLRTQASLLRSMTVNSNDTTRLTRLNQLIDLAVRQLAAEHPAAFVPDVEHLILEPDITTAATGTTVDVTADSYVLLFSGSAIIISKMWDGLMSIEVEDGAGGVHRHRCREFWVDGASKYVSLDRPINFTGTGLSFRLHQPAFWLTSDVTAILEGSLFAENGGAMQPLHRDAFTGSGRVDYRGNANGRPQAFWRREHHQIDAPLRAPTVVVAQDVWGPEPVGTFDYCFTYCWGVRTYERRSMGGSPEPLWESGPSPISAQAVVPDATFGVLLTLPEIAWQLNFNDGASLRSGHSGWYKRIYRRRVTTGSVPGHATIEAPNVFQFIAEIGDENTTYADDGSDIPDYHRRLPESQGYFGWVPWPHQDGRYELDLHVLRTPRALANDQDAPRVHAANLPMLVELAAHYFAQDDNDPAGAARHLDAYIRLARFYSLRQASPAAQSAPRGWGSYSSAPHVTTVTTD